MAAGFIAGAIAQVYYVDCRSSISGQGSEAQPYNDLSLLPTLDDNDVVRIARGCECEGSIEVEGNDVTIESYGNGPKPVIMGSVAVDESDWIWDGSIGPENSQGAWYIELPEGINVGQVYRGTSKIVLAQEPNGNKQLAQNWFRMDGFSQTATDNIIDDDLSTTFTSNELNELIGAEAVVRATNWQFDRLTILGATSNSISFPQSTVGGGTVPVNFIDGYSWGYFLRGKPVFMDENNEWCVISVNDVQRLYIKGGETERPDDVRYGSRPVGIKTYGNSGTEVRDISFMHQVLAGVESYIGENHVIANCDFQNLFMGIKDQTADQGVNQNHTYTNNYFHKIYDKAIASDGNMVLISENIIDEVGLEIHTGQAGFFGYHGIVVNGTDVSVIDNSMSNIGYTGVGFTGSGLIARNHINKCLQLLTDGAAIAIDYIDGLVVEDNIIVDPGGPINMVSAAPDFFQAEALNFGIYFGEIDIQNTSVIRNTVLNATVGVHVDHSRCTGGIEITDNVLFNNGVQLNITDFSNWTLPCGGNGDRVTDQGLGQPPNYVASYDDVYQGNILYGTNSEQLCMAFGHIWPGNHAQLVDFGTFTNNYYFNPYTDIVVQQSIKYQLGPGQLTHYFGQDDRFIPYTVDAWRNTSTPDQDATAVAHPLKLANYRLLPGSDPVLVDHHTDECLSNVRWGNGTSEVGDGAEVSPFDTEGRYLRFSNATFIERWSGLEDPDDNDTPIDLSDAGTYRYTIRSRSPNLDALQLAPVWRREGDGNQNYQRPIASFGLSESWRVQEIILDIPGGDNLVTAMQNVHRGYRGLEPTTVDIDYVRVEKVTLDPNYEAEIAANHLLRYNCPLPGAAMDDRNVAANGGVFVLPENTLEMPLCGLWSDVDGNIYAPGESIALDPWQSIIVFQVDPPQTLAGMDPNNQFFIPSGATEIWDEHMNVQGSVVVQDGGTLIVDGVTIGFAPSTQDITTNLEVKPGGTLIMRNGAHLTNWMGCAVPVGMWDGVKAGGSNTGPQPQVEMYTGSRISNAYTALMFRDGDPATPIPNAQGASLATGSRPKLALEGALFENNMHDIVLIPLLSTASTSLSMIDLDGPGGNDAVPSFIRKCTFRTSAALKQENAHPKHHLYLRSVHKLKVLGSTFENRRPDNAYSNPGHRGNGITGMNAQILVTEYDAQGEEGAPSVFAGLTYGVYASAVTKFVADVTRTRFDRCGGGIYLSSSVFARITENTFLVPDIDFALKGVSASYGTYLESSTGFELEENVYTGEDDTDHPKVGAIFRNCGPEFNEYYRNTFANFRSRERNSMGTLIMGDNFGAQGGLKFTCNTYSAEPDRLNDLDIAMNGAGVRISANQGVNLSPQTMAGNTFANFTGTDCGGSDERHLFVDAEAVSGLNVFTYWHHVDQPNIELRPHCVSFPILEDNSDPSLNWIRGTTYQYDPDNTCREELGRDKGYFDALSELGEVKSEHALLKEVYGDWSDGGDTEGLKDFIRDESNGSYALRNQLMLVAPKVSHEVWEMAFKRVPAMDPWHLAQALMANSPLELETMVLLDSSLVNPYYKQLVLDGQNGGVSMHSIYKGELSALYSRKSRAASDALALALGAESQGKIDSALMVLDGSKLEDEGIFRAALLHWEGDHTGVRLVIDDQLAAVANDPYWTIQDLAYEQLESDKDLAEVDAAVVQQLQTIAQSLGAGAAEARAWLNVHGELYDEPVILPELSKRARPHAPHRSTFTWTPLSVFPNPSEGQLNIAFEVPLEVQRAEVRVMDALGQLIFSDELSGTGVVRMDVPVHATGLRIVALYFDGHLIGTEKVQMMK